MESLLNLYFLSSVGTHCRLLNFCGALNNYTHKTTIISRYLRGLMGTFNERAEKLMTKLSDIADNKTEAKMLHLVNYVTLDVIAKVLCHCLFVYSLHCSFS